MKIKKHFNLDSLLYLLKTTQKNIGIVYAVTTAIITFIPIDDVLNLINCNTIGYKISFLLFPCLISLVIALTNVGNKKCITVFSKEKKRIQLEYGNIKDYIIDNSQNEPYTVVIPINTHLSIVGDKRYIRENSIHGLWIEHMNSCGYNADSIKGLVARQKTLSDESVCKIGDFAYIKDIKNVNYMLIASCEIDNAKSQCSTKQYFIALQSLIEALAVECKIQEKIYIPVIGGGYAYMQKTNQQLLRVMSEVLIFNESILQHEIHVVVFEDLKDEIQLLSFDR